MRKIFLTIKVLTLSITTVYADITPSQVNEYIKVSRAGQMIELDKIKTEKQFYKQLNLKKEDAKAPIKNEFKNFINNSERFNICQNTFLRLDNMEYIEIMNFYNTSVGKKYAKLLNGIAGMSQKEIKNKYIQLKNNRILYDSKEDLIKNIYEAFNLTNVQMNIVKKTLLLTNRTMTKDHRIKAKKNIEANHPIVQGVVYAEFSENELQNIITYARSNAGKNEIKYLYNLSSKLGQYNVSRTLKSFERWSTIRLCQKYNIENKSYPKFCEVEWLSSE